MTERFRGRPWIRRGLVALVVGVVVTAMVWSLQRRLIYFPGGAPPPVAQVLPGASEVSLTSAGPALSAWFLPGGTTAVLVLPGNAGNRGDRAPLARGLAGLGVSVLLVDYRGYGGNPGRPSEQGLAADARAAAAWLTARADVERIVVFGESIGAAVAVGLATQRPRQRDQPPAGGAISGLVLRSPFTSLGDVARLFYGPVPDWVLRDRYPSEARIGAVDVPVLVVAGGADEIVPPALSRRLFTAAPEPKQLVVVPGAGHNDAAVTSGAPLLQAVGDFLAAHDLLPDGGA